MQFDLNLAIDVLDRTPRVLRELIDGLSDAWTMSNEGPDTWSPYDVIGHLIHGEDTDWIPRAQIILSDAVDKTFIPFDRFAMFNKSRGKSLSDLLREFEQKRQQNLDTIRAMQITPNDLDKTGRHPELGTVTLRHLLAAWVVHDLGHIHQISRVMAKQYGGEVGPWPAYMKVLS